MNPHWRQCACTPGISRDYPDPKFQRPSKRLRWSFLPRAFESDPRRSPGILPGCIQIESSSNSCFFQCVYLKPINFFLLNQHESIPRGQGDNNVPLKKNITQLLDDWTFNFFSKPHFAQPWPNDPMTCPSHRQGCHGHDRALSHGHCHGVATRSAAPKTGKLGPPPKKKNQLLGGLLGVWN